MAQLERQLRAIAVAGVDDVGIGSRAGPGGKGGSATTTRGGIDFGSGAKSRGGAGSVRAHRRRLHGLDGGSRPGSDAVGAAADTGGSAGGGTADGVDARSLPSIVRLLEIRSALLVRLFDFLVQRKQRLDLSLGIMSDAQLLATSIQRQVGA